MTKDYTYKLILFLSILGLSFTALDWQSITPKDAMLKFENLSKKMESNSNFSVQVNHRTFRNYTISTWEMQYDGFIKKQGKNYISLLTGIYTIQNEKYKAVIDTNKALILVTMPSGVADLAFSSQQTEQSLKQCKSIKTKIENESTFYEIVFPNAFNFEKTVMSFNKNEMPLSYKMYLNKKVKAVANGVETEDKPRIEINYTNYKYNTKFNINEFSCTKYFSEINGKLVLATAFKKYQLKDLRVQTKK